MTVLFTIAPNDAFLQTQLIYQNKSSQNYAQIDFNTVFLLLTNLKQKSNSAWSKKVINESIDPYVAETRISLGLKERRHPLEVFYKKSCSQKFQNICRKTPVLESWRYRKKCSNARFFSDTVKTSTKTERTTDN